MHARLVLATLATSSLHLGSIALNAQNPGESPESALRLARFETHKQMAAKSPFAKHRWQFVGPQVMRGRITDVAAHPERPGTIYAASASGGVFKTTDEGGSWTPIFADQATASIGDIAIAPTAPDTIWVGTGEANILRSSMAGTGIYKSNDGGKTFAYSGLADTQHIARVVVHPKDPDTVYVASAGHEYTHDRSRGIYKTTDGGRTWRQVFHQDVKTGVIDLAIDPQQPEILYACTAERLRRRWQDPQPGPQSGVWQSTDAGATWRRLAGGLPDFASGRYERIGIDVCRSRPRTVYVAMHKVSGSGEGAQVYRSDDRGKTFARVPGSRQVRRVFPAYGWFFGQIRVDPLDPESVYILGLSFMASNDGGKTWRTLRGTHADYHAMWIDPTDPKHLLVGNDGGLMISKDRFETYDAPRNLPIAQCYNAGVSRTKGAFQIYCAVQDQGAWFGTVDVSGRRDAIERREWQRGPGDESGRHAVDPTNPDIVHYVNRYGGGPMKAVMSQRGSGRQGAAGRRGGGGGGPDFGGERKRSQWVSPLIISPHSPKRLLYGAQFLFASDDGGDTWQRISPDLSNFDPDRQGNIPHAVVFAIAESPLRKGVIWAGTDDGNIQVTRDGGKTWTDPNVGVPAGRCVSSLCASTVDEGTAFATVSGKRHDDFECYVLKSTDYGATWQSIGDGIPGSSANVVVQDPDRPDTLYVGTDRAVYVSTDGGGSWHVLGAGLPTVYVHDLVVQTEEDFLVIATHGRGCYVLDVRELRRR